MTDRLRKKCGFVLGVIAVSGCIPSSHAPLVAPPAYPRAGFGRIGCYAGASLSRMTNAVELTPGAATRGPWLVLDSLTSVELRAAGYRDSEIDSRDLFPGTLLEQRDTIERTWGSWHRVAPDSVVFQEGSVFPPVDWHFRITSSGIVGQGVLVHDVVDVDPDGTRHSRVSSWPVNLVQIDCAQVPLAPNR